MPKKSVRLPYVQRLKRAHGQFSYRGWVKVGNSKEFSPSFRTEQEAYEAHLRMKKTANAPIREGVTLDEACEIVLEEVKAKRTEGHYRWCAGHFDAVRRKIPGTTAMHRITPETIEKFIRDRLQDWAKVPKLDEHGEVEVPGRRVKPATINADLRALHRAFTLCLRRGYVDENPLKKVDRPRADAVAMDWFTQEEVRALLAKVDDLGARDLFTLLAMTGIRRSEAGRLTVAHVRLQLSQLVVPGKNATRVVPLNGEAADALERMLGNTGLPRGVDAPLIPFGLPQIDKAFATWKVRLGERRLHAHALRHTFGTGLIRLAVRPDVVMRLMGHGSLNTTMRYVHEVGGDGAEAVARLASRPHDGSDHALGR